MNISIQTKLLAFCVLLVVLTAVSTSATYYILLKQDKQQESQQRIQIAFDLIFDDLAQQHQFYVRQMEEFINNNSVLEWSLFTYKTEPAKLSEPLFIVSYLAPFAGKLKDFSDVIGARQLALYAADQRLLAVYRRDDTDEIDGLLGIYVTSSQGQPSFISVEDASMLLGTKTIPDTPLPASLSASYPENIPQTVMITTFRQDMQLGVRVAMPIARKGELVGVLVGEILYSQTMVDRYAALSKTDVNVFAGENFSLGTLRAQTSLAPQILNDAPACDAPASTRRTIPVTSLIFDEQPYYQGYCVLVSGPQRIGAVTVSLSQAIARAAIRKVLTAVLTIAAIVACVGFGVSVLFSRKSIHTIHALVRVMSAAAEGDLRASAISATRDEFGLLARRLNQMISQLRSISKQVQGSSSAVNGSADTILQQMGSLMTHMEQQVTSVQETTGSVGKVNQFVDSVAQNTSELLTTSALILSSIQEMQGSIKEVSTSTGALTTNLHLISASVDQVNQSAKQVSEDTGKLEELAHQTRTEIQRIDQSLRGVSEHAEHNQQSAQKTMDAATMGQVSVDASVHGITELKKVVTNTAEIIREVNSWGEQVSSILDIVDEIASQTSLLALNASIISAQAGAHGRGFAVVADEIKELATRTQLSTREIATLIHALQKKTAEGVKNTEDGITKAEEGVQLAQAVKAALATILDQATQASDRAADTVQVIHQTTASSQVISTSMNGVTEMVSHIRSALQTEGADIEQVVSAVENISGMAEQVSRATLEQQKAAEQIIRSMQDATEKFSGLSDQTASLRQDSHQMLTAMETIQTITEKILHDTADISGTTVKTLSEQSEILQNSVQIFKVS
jgi:methyl-accepting chemotaxis protein